jgi:hypothetical protein
MAGTWITGQTRSGKTTQVVAWFEQWCQQQGTPAPPQQLRLAFPPQPGILVLSAISDNRSRLQADLTQVSQARFPFRSTTPLGFFEDEVKLFWALLVDQLQLPALFPLRLRPETEQEWAYRLWQAAIDAAVGDAPGRAARLVRHLLDLMQLAALSQTPSPDIGLRLQQGFGAAGAGLPLTGEQVVGLIDQWRDWCYQHGLLTYSLIAELYGQHLLPHPVYRSHLKERYQVLIADDVDEYPAMARSLFDTFLAHESECVFSFNPEGAVRLGLGADPREMQELSRRCTVQGLEPTMDSVAPLLQVAVLDLVNDPIYLASLPDTMQTIQATTRAQLIRQTAEMIATAVQSGQVAAEEVAIIGPGLDPISRYALREILWRQGIAVELVNDQRPLVSAAIVRALLTLLTLVYPGLGRLVDGDLVAEMLVTLTAQGQAIDAVRAGLLADHCFVPDIAAPQLLSSKVFPRWDRLGFQVTEQYERILQWIGTQQQELPNLSPVVLLDRAIQTFYLTGSPSFEQLATLRELMETAQHYWELAARLQHRAPALHLSDGIGRLIQLLRNGTVTANPFPARRTGAASQAVTLATVFQYRSIRCCHRWQFWFDAGSDRWLNGVDGLFGAPLFLRDYDGENWTIDDQLRMNEQRLERILPDLLNRTTEQVFLCYSDLATNGQEQMGVLLPLVNAAMSYGAIPNSTILSLKISV